MLFGSAHEDHDRFVLDVLCFGEVGPDGAVKRSSFRARLVRNAQTGRMWSNNTTELRRRGKGRVKATNCRVKEWNGDVMHSRLAGTACTVVTVQHAWHSTQQSHQPANAVLRESSSNQYILLFIQPINQSVREGTREAI